MTCPSCNCEHSYFSKYGKACRQCNTLLDLVESDAEPKPDSRIPVLAKEILIARTMSGKAADELFVSRAFDIAEAFIEEEKKRFDNGS